MVKISVGRSDDGEGPSSGNPIHKRRKLHEAEEQQQGFEIEDPPIVGTEDEEQNNVGNDQSAGFSTDKSISVTITDPDVLDCCICFEPLTAPIFQCESGHIACSNCCARLGKECPMCSMPIGYNRCRAIEKVVESIKMSCLNAKYGCKEKFSYSKKNEHEKKCIYLPRLCPHSGCHFVASSKELFLHFSHRHVGSGIQFVYDKFLTVILNIDHKAIVLQEKNDSNVFIVHNNREQLGNIVYLSCIGPKSERGFHYEILARSQGSSLILISITKIIQGFFADPPSTGRLLIPTDFFGSGQLKLDIRIRFRRL